MALRPWRFRSWPAKYLSRSFGSRTDSREWKEEQIAIGQERIFGPQGNMPGDRQLRKKLEGRKLMRWYFPSKYNLQDFKNQDYFEMHQERFAPRVKHQTCGGDLREDPPKSGETRRVLQKPQGGRLPVKSDNTRPLWVLSARFAKKSNKVCPKRAGVPRTFAF